jgi:WD40 repeat protein
LTLFLVYYRRVCSLIGSFNKNPVTRETTGGRRRGRRVSGRGVEDAGRKGPELLGGIVMGKVSKLAGLVAGALLFGTAGFAQGPSRPPTVEIPGERLELALRDPLSGRALVTRPLPITGVLSWSLETRRHRGAIWCHALSPDGRVLATGGLDGSIRLWDVESGRLTRALVGHNSYVSGLDWSPDGNTLASAGTYDVTVRLWDTRTGRPLRVLNGHPAEVSLVKWSPDGRTVLATGGQSGALSSWNAITGVKYGTLELGQPLPGMSWHPDGKSVALVGRNLPVQIWDAATNKVTRTVGNAKDGFLCVSWDPEGKTLAAGTAANTLLFDGTSGKVLHTLSGSSYALTWAEGGKELATLMPDSIKVWDAAEGTLQTTIPVADARSLAASPDFATFLTGSPAAFAVHERATGNTVRRFDNLSGTEPPLWWAGKTLITGIGSLKLSQWDAETGKRLRVLDGHTAPISAVAVSPGGTLLATASHDKTVRLWESATGKLTQTFSEHAAPVLAVSFSPDGRTVASAGADNKVLVWEASSGQLLHTLTGSPGAVTALAWKPGTSTVLLSNGKGTAAQAWNVRAGKADATLEGTGEMVSLAWSPDGARAAGGQGDGDLVVWQEVTGKLMHTLKEPGSPPAVTALAWSPNGQVLAAGRGNHTLQLWDPKGGTKLFSLPTMAPVLRVSWTAGSTTVGVSSQDRTARFFDADTGKLRAVLVAEDEQLIAVSFEGHYRAPAAESELVYVIQTRTSQDTYTPSQFAAKFALKNAPAKVSLFGK